MVVVGGKNLSSSTFDVGLLPASKSPSAQNDCCSGSCSRPPSPANLSIIESLQWKACSVDQEEKMPTFPILICSFRERFQKQKKTTFHLVDVVELAAPLLHALHVSHDPAVLGPEKILILLSSATEAHLAQQVKVSVCKRLVMKLFPLISFQMF